MSEKQLLNVKNLYVDVEEKQILHGVDLSIGKGETHVLMGPNGTGKSTLGYALMGNPRYTIKSGEIWFQGKNITEAPVNERAKAGIFLSFQNPLEVPGAAAPRRCNAPAAGFRPRAKGTPDDFSYCREALKLQITDYLLSSAPMHF